MRKPGLEASCAELRSGDASSSTRRVEPRELADPVRSGSRRSSGRPWTRELSLSADVSDLFSDEDAGFSSAVLENQSHVIVSPVDGLLKQTSNSVGKS